MRNNYKVEGDQITFLDSRYYHSDGVFCPSVTTILDAYPKDYHFFKWLKENGEDSDKIRDAAGARGSAVHEMTEDYDNGQEVSLLNIDGLPSTRIDVWAMFTKYVEFRDSMPMEIIANEMQLIDLELMEAGTLDRFMEIDGKRMIIDIKTSNSIHKIHWLQLAAYRRLFTRRSKEVVDAVGILWLNAKTRGAAKGKIQGAGWQLLVEEDSSDDLMLYDCTKTLWREQNKGVIPRQLSYKIKHKLVEA